MRVAFHVARVCLVFAFSLAVLVGCSYFTGYSKMNTYEVGKVQTWHAHYGTSHVFYVGNGTAKPVTVSVDCYYEDTRVVAPGMQQGWAEWADTGECKLVKTLP